MENTPTAVVAGATGYIGRHIVQALHEAGYRVRALARDEKRLELVRDACDEVFVGHATKQETLEGLCDGADVVISSLGLRTLRSRPTPEDVDFHANLNVLTQARKAGVRQFIVVSALHADELATSVPILRPREEFVRRLRRSELTWTVLRPTGAFNDLKEIFRFAQWGWGILLGGGTHRINPVHPADIADVAVRAIADTSLHHTEFGFGGPDMYTHREITDLAAHVLGKRLRTVRFPCWPVDMAVRAVHPLNRNAAGFLRFFRQSLSTDMVGTPTGTRRLSDFYVELARKRKTERT